MSVRVDFYVLARADRQAGWLFAARLAEKAYKHKQKLYIYCANQTDAQALDDLLWTFDEASFIPHLLEEDIYTETFAPIRIGHGPPRQSYPLILNLSFIVPPFYQQSERVMEIVFGDEAQRAATRDRFRIYRTEGCTMHTHQMNNY